MAHTKRYAHLLTPLRYFPQSAGIILTLMVSGVMVLAPPALGQELSVHEGTILLRIARDTLSEYLNRQTTPKLSSYEVTERLSQKRGVFVTLKDRHTAELRGCIGYTEGYKTLAEAVIDCTVYAATRDIRFRPLRAGEEKEVVIEISVLSPLQPVSTIEQIRVGVHGLVLTNGLKTGVLLPQVPLEQHWSRDEFLRALCRKADLPDRAWEHGGQLFAFTAQIFSERH